jgi:DNA-binding response OmpR family regulator
MRLLLVEDDSAIQGVLQRALVDAGYQVDTASNAKAGESKALQGGHDTFIIDLGLPDMDGLDLIARCRAQGSPAPVLILSARRSVDERVKGLEHGGDDYLTKPFALAELLARRAFCKRTRFLGARIGPGICGCSRPRARRFRAH